MVASINLRYRSSNKGYRFIYDQLRAVLPQLQISQRQVARALVIIDPASAAARQQQLSRREVRDGAFYAPYFGYLWQSDCNWVLARWGLGHGIVYDMASSSVFLRPLMDKLTATVWTEVNRPAAVKWGGLPDKWTTDKGTETYITAFFCR